MEISIDDWPVVVFKLIKEPEDEETVNTIIKQWTEIYIESMKRNEKFRLVFDVTRITSIKLEFLKLIGSFLIKVKSLTESWMNRTVIIVSDDNIYRLISFVFTFYKPVRPFKVFKNHIEAIEWVISEEPGETFENKLASKKSKSEFITFD